jgi:hypothetical protein
MGYDFSRRLTVPLTVEQPKAQPALTEGQRALLLIPGVVGCFPQGTQLRVLLANGGAAARLPREVDGLAVVPEVVGEIVAQ